MTVNMKAPLEIGISVQNLDRAAEFYEHVLGFERISEATLAPDRAALAGFGPVSFRMVRFQTNQGERIKLLQQDPPAEVDTHDRALLGRTGITYLTFVVTDIEAAIERLRAAHVALSSDGPIQTRPGTRLLFFRDCEGNPLELVQYDDLAAYRPDLKR